MSLPVTDREKIPKIGFGTYQLRGDVAYSSVICALNAGYAHIDGAKLYKNEEDVGRAIQDHGTPRNKLFLTTKVLNKDQIRGKERILREFEKTLKALRTDCVDLLLLHNPLMDYVAESWKVLEYLYMHKKCHMIGVSNFEISDLKYFEGKATVKPMVNQIELSPFYVREQLVEYCRKNNIIVEAHTSLTRGEKLKHVVLCKMAEKYKVSSAQIMIKWALQKDYIILPRSSDREQIRENISTMVDISEDDILILNELDEKFCLTVRRNEDKN